MEIATAIRDPDRPWIIIHKARGDAAEIERLLDQYSRLSREIRREFAESIAALAAQIDINRIAELIRQGRIAEAIDVVSAAQIAAGVQPIAAEAAQGALQAGRLAARTIPIPSGARWVFDLTNPQTAVWLREYEFNLIRELTRQARLSVAETVRAGVQAGINPLTTAREVRANIGLTGRQAAAVANYRRLLQANSAEALTRALRDRRYDPSIRRAIASGRPLSAKQINKMVARYRARYLKYRSQMIARTESIRAVNAGNRRAWQQAVDDGQIEESRIIRKWVRNHDNKVRDSHRAIPKLNKNGVGLNEPFKSPLGPIMEPGDPNASAANTIACRCTQIIRYQARASDG